jgi:hypothetical protein
VLFCRLVLRLIVLGALWIWAVVWLGVNVLGFNTSWPVRDFTAFYETGLEFWQNGTLYTLPHPYLNLNAPHVSVILFAPLALLRERTAALLWSGLSAACLAATLLIARAEVPQARSRFNLIIALVVASPAMHHQWRQGQVGAIFGLLGIAAWRSARHASSTMPWWLASTISLKPWVAILLIAQPLRIAVRTVVIGIIGILLGVFLCGLPNWLAWRDAMATHDVWPTPSNGSLFGMALRFSGQREYGSELASPAFVYGIWLPAIAIMFVTTIVRIRQADTDRAWLACLSAGLLISPIGWSYYQFVLLGPLIAWGERQQWPFLVLMALTLLMIPVPWLSAAWRSGSPMIGSLYTIAMLLLWACVVYSVERAPVRT